MNFVGGIIIRAAALDDIDAILSLDREIERLPHWAVADYRAALVGVGSEPRRCLFVVEAGGKIEGLAVGMVQTIAGESWAELETVGVAPGMQRRGLGRELCRTVIDWCWSQGASQIDLEVRSRSIGPIALYRELGFVIAGKRPDYYRDPSDAALLMRLVLKRDPAEPVGTAEPAS